MLNLGKAARWMVVAAAPLAMAQSPRVRQPSPRPVGTPAAAPSPAVTSAPAVRPAPDSPRFVTNQNFFRAPARPQPTTNSQPAAQPAGAQPATGRSTLPVTPRALPLANQPAAAISVPALSAPQPPAVPPVLITPSSANSVGHDLAAVDFSHGELTVVAQHAPLGLVLKLIAARTGAVVDLAPELQNEPVMAQLGPAPIREVLTALLDSPRVDYIVMAAGDDPNTLRRVVVRTRQAFSRVAMATVPPQQPKRAEVDPEATIDENGRLPNGPTPAMENWQKTREAMRVAEIKQQAEDREREKTQPQQQPEPQSDPQPDNPPQR